MKQESSFVFLYLSLHSLQYFAGWLFLSADTVALSMCASLSTNFVRIAATITTTTMKTTATITTCAHEQTNKQQRRLF